MYIRIGVHISAGERSRRVVQPPAREPSLVHGYREFRGFIILLICIYIFVAAAASGRIDENDNKKATDNTKIFLK